MDMGSQKMEIDTIAIAPNWVGDTVMAIPALETIRYHRKEKFAILAKENLAPIIPGKVYTKVELLKNLNIKEVFIFPLSFKSAILANKLKPKVTVGFKYDFRSILLTHPVEIPYTEKIHHSKLYFELLKARKIPVPEKIPDPQIHISNIYKKKAYKSLRAAKIDPETDKIIGIFPGASFGSSKRWGITNYARLINKLRKLLPTFKIIILTGLKDLNIAVDTYILTGKKAPVIGANLNLGELSAVIEKLTLYIGNDTGPSHIAAALGIKTITLFGPTSPKRFKPLGKNSFDFYKNIWCSPCYHKICPLIHKNCLRSITDDEIIEKALSILQAAS